jgi:hypothetical protein
MKKYYTTSWSGGRIDEVEIVRETKSSVFLKDTRRRRKVTDSERYCDTWKEAHDWLIGVAERRLSTARRQLEIAQGFSGNVRGMKEPV